ncbi:MAG: hypothetical protein CMJ59_08645 [Planctomycetaceae bacterium]|nr:hypothetical protein [Planctomycetaceae bacterium]
MFLPLTDDAGVFHRRSRRVALLRFVGPGLVLGLVACSFAQDVVPPPPQTPPPALRQLPGAGEAPPATESPDRDPDREQSGSGEEPAGYPSDPQLDLPHGFSGPSSILPRENQIDPHFVPIEDRWRLAPSTWDRYGKGHPAQDDYPFVLGNRWNPYRQNVLKGDYPIWGQNTFLNFTGESRMLLESRQVPTPTTPFETTVNPRQEEFFGDPNQYFYNQNFIASFDLMHGLAGFKQPDWRLRVSAFFNMNYLDTNELGLVNPDVREGTTRFREDFALEEWFAEAKIADLSPNYDTLSVRMGSQLFVSDFRGFIFSDINRGVRLFGTGRANLDQFNLVWFDQTAKEVNSELNTFEDRGQNTVVANYYRQDFIWPGFTMELSFHSNHDKASLKYDENDFLVRPDAAGVAQPHRIESYYFGVANSGHIGRLNINNAFYWVTGDDALNPLAGRPVEIDAVMGAFELSYDRDWMRFRTSYFFASGDPDINDDKAEGFDAIFDNPNFAGGEFSYWQRQAVRLLGVNLVNRASLLPDMRSSKTVGQTNFVNPGLQLANFGVDADITPKTKLIGNVNFLWFNQTEILETFVFQSDVHNYIGADMSLGVEYRPHLNNNILFVGGVSGLVPGRGFKDLYNPLGGSTGNLFASFLETILVY